MLTLPKANPFRENIPADKIILSDILKKLASESFTGYIVYFFSEFNAFCLFASGKVVSIISKDSNLKLSGFEALSSMFAQASQGNGEISIYRMTPDMVMCAHALLEGERITDTQEVRQIDIKAVLAEMKELDLNGVVRFAASDRHAMIFYKEGTPIGFYHDGATTIDTSPEESRKVAAIPGAVLDIFSTSATEEVTRHDLLHMINLDKLWGKYAKAVSPSPSIIEPPPQPADSTSLQPEKLAELIEDMQEVAVAYLSKSGRGVIEKCLLGSGGSEIFLENNRIEAFLDLVRRDAMEIDSHARIEEMIDLMRTEIAERLSGT